MPKASTSPIPITISVAAPSTAPATANVWLDVEANQIQLKLFASGADVTLAAGAGVNLLWFYDPLAESWICWETSFLAGGWVVADGYGCGDLLRSPVGSSALHLQAVGATNLGNLTGTVTPVFGGA